MASQRGEYCAVHGQVDIIQNILSSTLLYELNKDIIRMYVTWALPRYVRIYIRAYVQYIRTVHTYIRTHLTELKVNIILRTYVLTY